MSEEETKAKRISKKKKKKEYCEAKKSQSN